MKTRAYFFFLIIIGIFFLYSFFTLKMFMLGGDNLLQFYPWHKVYAESIKEFRFPFWLRSIHSGFPLMAEGQIGGFYPLNILLFYLLPFPAAYNYTIIVHFFLGMAFMFLYTRKLKISPEGTALATLVFCFGSTFCGGFYNLITLKTLCWFPLVLFLFEQYFESSQKRFMFIASGILGMQFLAGFIQVAFYSVLFYCLYYAMRAYQKKRQFFKNTILFICFVTIGLIIYIPQLVLSYPLIVASTRTSVGLAFALWGSLSPFSFLKFLCPYIFLGLRETPYVGVVSIPFLIFSLFYARRQKILQPILVMFLVALFLSLGRYNPLYVAILKALGLYAFRNPSKFLFFALFAASVLIGLGFSLFEREEALRRRSIRCFLGLVTLFGLVVAFIKGLLCFFQNQKVAFVTWYVKRFIYGQAHHRYTLDFYITKALRLYEGLMREISFKYNIYFVISAVLIALTVLLFFYLLKSKKPSGLWRLAVFVMLFSDLFIQARFFFLNDILPLSVLRPDNKAILALLKKDRELFRILPFNLNSARLPKWARPNANIIYGLDSIAVYTPLLEQDYFLELAQLSVIDDSLGFLPTQEELFAKHFEKIRLLNVKYVIAPDELRHSGLKLFGKEEGIYLYRLKDYLPRVFFTYSLKDQPLTVAKAERLLMRRYSDGYLAIEVTNSQPGYIVFSENYFPGWQAYVDGKKVRIVQVSSLIQAVFLHPGSHTIQFIFHPLGRQ